MFNKTNLRNTCINDLVQKANINYEKKKPRSVYDRLPNMQQKFEEAKKKGDDETAYIFLKRWLDTIEWLKKPHKGSESIHFNIDEVKNVL